jgi:hypothetical protein
MTAPDYDVHTEALFVSHLQSSQQPTPELIRAAVTATVQRLGENGCAALVARSSANTPTRPSAGCAGPARRYAPPTSSPDPAPPPRLGTRARRSSAPARQDVSCLPCTRD